MEQKTISEEHAERNKEIREEIAKLRVKNRELIEQCNSLKAEIKDLKYADNKIILEPIRVAESLIHAEYEYGNDIILKAFSGITVAKSNAYSKSELRQIAEHLLVYCNRTEE